MKPFFTAIIPTYNRRKLLQEAVASILEQRFDDYEVIVVDAGSSDGTRDYLRSLGSRVRVVTQSTEGPGAARNLGIAAAAGDYLAFLDSDDLWFPWSLETYATVVRDGHQPAFIAGKPLRFQRETDLVQPRPEPTRFEQFSDYLASGDEWRWWGVSSFVIRRDVLLESGGFTETNMNGEDADLALKLGEAHGFVQIHAPFTFGYREHAGNLTADLAKTLAGVQHKIRTEIANGYPGGETRADERRRILTRHVRPVALACLRSGLRGAAWQLYRATLPWHIRLRRWKFVIGFPLRACLIR